MNTVVRNLPESPRQIWLWTAVASMIAHVTIFGAVGQTRIQKPTTYQKVQMKIAEPVAEPKLVPKPKKQPTPKPAPNEPSKNAKPDVAPIQGVTKSSVADQGTMSAPVGNTMMVEDTGKRVKDAQPLSGDMSAPAILIRDSIQTPPYTEQAIDVSLEGTWVVDVFVDLSGKVTSAELRKKIGYGMDERVLTAARQARFSPRKNKLGVSEPGWAEIKFVLVIP